MCFNCQFDYFLSVVEFMSLFLVLLTWDLGHFSVAWSVCRLSYVTFEHLA